MLNERSHALLFACSVTSIHRYIVVFRWWIPYLPLLCSAFCVSAAVFATDDYLCEEAEDAVTLPAVRLEKFSTARQLLLLFVLLL